MALYNQNPTTTPAWEALRAHFYAIENQPMRQYFQEDPHRANRFSIRFDNLYLDYSKNRIDATTLSLFDALAQQMRLSEGIQAMFSGELINATEKRAVLHTALRANPEEVIQLDGVNVVEQVHAVRSKIKVFSERVISGEYKGYTGKTITDVVNIGIGGSDLGPAMVTQALSFYKNHLNLHYVSNIDGDGLHELLQRLDAETTLFIVVSKTFTTQETMTNALTIKDWLVHALSQEAVSYHFVAVSSNLKEVEKFGIQSENIFPMWDWVGGRFSLWSAVGLSVALSIGYENFDKLLAGAKKIDTHFKETEFTANIPVVLAFLSIWYNNFYGAQSHCVVPYSDYLTKLVPYLQQLVMESNGKNISREGLPVNTQTGNIIFGEIGSNSQHAYFQLLHQGTKLIPADFIGFKKPLNPKNLHHNLLMANFFAQTQALMQGRAYNDALGELAPFKEFYGNKPTNTLLFDQLTPEALGMLLAIYEHKTFVEGYLWNIYSFDQFGVELGKELANTLIEDISKGQISNHHDASTKNLLREYLK